MLEFASALARSQQRNTRQKERGKREKGEKKDREKEREKLRGMHEVKSGLKWLKSESAWRS